MKSCINEMPWYLCHLRYLTLSVTFFSVALGKITPNVTIFSVSLTMLSMGIAGNIRHSKKRKIPIYDHAKGRCIFRMTVNGGKYASKDVQEIKSCYLPFAI